MFSSNGYYDLPRITSFTHAVAMEQLIQPIRGSGRNAGIKPLGSRSRTHIQILNYTKEVAIRLYRTDILRYRECPETGADQIGIFFGEYDTQTTVAVMNRVLPPELSIQIFDGKVWLKYRSPNLPYDASLVCAIDPFTVTWVTEKDGFHVPNNPPKITVHKIDRKAA